MSKSNERPTINSSSKRDPQEEEYNVGILEQDLVNDYQISRKTRHDRTMIVMYRMNCKNNNPGGRYEGRVNFRVGMGEWHVMSRNTVDYSTANAFFNFRPGHETFNTVKNKALHLCDNEKVSRPHCSIVGPRYPDDFLWIEDHRSEHGTFVNGKKIPRGGKCRVFYGDVIGLGAPYDTVDQWGDPNDDKRGFVFTVKNFEIRDSESQELSTDLDPNPTPTFLAMNNTVILDTILIFLNMKHLKSARLVNRFWKNRVDPRLLGAGFMSFSHGSETRGEQEEEDWDTSFQGKVSMIREYGLGNWELEINYMNNKNRRRVHTDVQWLVEHMGHHARNLQLRSDCWPHPWRSIPNVMSHLWNLENLKICLESRLPLTEDYFFAPTTFPSVTQLNLSIKFIQDPRLRDPGWARPRPRFSLFTQMFPNIRKFEASGHQFHSVVEYIHENPQVWPNLKELGGAKTYYGLGTIRMISTLPHKLTKIEYTTKGFSKDLGYDLELMMKNHSETLEHLHLSFSVISAQHRNILRFPSFPRLKVLGLCVTLHWASDRKLHRLEIIFPSGGSVLYEEDLPQIRKLRVKFYSYDVNYENGRPLYIGIAPIMKQVMNVFVPEDGETLSRTMRWVDFGIKIKESSEEGLNLHSNPWYNEFVQRFIKVFPYCHNPHIIKRLKLLNIQD